MQIHISDDSQICYNIIGIYLILKGWPDRILYCSDSPATVRVPFFHQLLRYKVETLCSMQDHKWFN